MGGNESRVFNLLEANGVVPQLAQVTAEVIRRLDSIRRRYREDSSDEESLPPWVLQEVERTLQAWSEKVQKLGATPKGYFTVDFQTIDPEVLYCWTYGEEEISFTHKVWENFSHRRPIGSDLQVSGEHSKWIH